MHMIVSRAYAAIVFLYVMLLLGLAVNMLLYGGHAAPGGILFLLPSVLLAALIPFLWRGRRWASLLALLVSFVPGVWPLFWYQLTGPAPSAGRATIVIAGRRLFLPWWEILLLLAPMLFAVLTVICFVAATKTRVSAD